MERKVVIFGTSAKVTCQKEYLEKDAILVILKQKSYDTKSIIKNRFKNIGGRRLGRRGFPLKVILILGLVKLIDYLEVLLIHINPREHLL